MTQYLVDLFKFLSSAFSHRSTYSWFVVVVFGFIARSDFRGISSIIRALHLPGKRYFSVRHFFMSSAWNCQALLSRWLAWVATQNVAHISDDRLILIGDHTKCPKDGQKMPGVYTLHQESESASKPSFFRGHQWAFISLLARSKDRFFALPLWAQIHPENSEDSQITHLVSNALTLASSWGRQTLLVLDAFFASKTAFTLATASNGTLHILTRAKKSCVAYIPAEPSPVKRKGRKKLYGPKLRLIELFDTDPNLFLARSAHIYKKTESIHILCIDLIWRPTKNLVRFILAQTSHGRIILMSSDLTIDPVHAMELYCHRYHIESFFAVFKNVLGGLSYHFWSKYLEKSSRKPLKRKLQNQSSSHPLKTNQTLDAIHKFVTIQIIVAGILQLLACKFPEEVNFHSRCWLRTRKISIPSEFVTSISLKNIISSNFVSLRKSWIIQFLSSRFIESIFSDSHAEVA